jgi:hypothetical protein
LIRNAVPKAPEFRAVPRTGRTSRRTVGLSEKRNCRDGDNPPSLVEAGDAVDVVCRLALAERDPRGQLVKGHGPPVERFRVEEGRPALGRHLVCFRERSTEDLLCGLVVEDEVTFRVSDEHRRCQLRSELAREDEDQILLALAVHGLGQA